MLLFSFNCYYSFRRFNEGCSIRICISALDFAENVISDQNLNDQFSKKMFLTVGVMFKNESHVLKEWLDHYIYHGVDHIFMINDGSTDDYKSVLKPYLDNNYITLFDASDFPRFNKRQALLYDLFFLPHSRHVEWMAVLDMDEFLYSPYEVNLKKVFLSYENYASVQVNWAVFSSNNLEKQPFSVVEGFTKRAYLKTFQREILLNPGIGTEKHLTYKSISRLSCVRRLFAHFSIVNGDTLDLTVFLTDKLPFLIVNHYFCQSREYWKNKKMPSGSANMTPDFINRGWELFDSRDLSDVEDLCLYEQNKEIIKKLKS